MALPLVPVVLTALAAALGWGVYSYEKKTTQVASGRLTLEKGKLYQVNFFVPGGQAVMLGTTGWQPTGAAPQKVSAGTKLPDGRGPFDGYTMQATWTGPTASDYYMVNPLVAGSSGNVVAKVTLLGAGTATSGALRTAKKHPMGWKGRRRG